MEAFLNVARLLHVMSFVFMSAPLLILLLLTSAFSLEHRLTTIPTVIWKTL